MCNITRAIVIGYAVTISCVLLPFNTLAETNDGELALEKQFKSKRAIKKEWNRVKELIYDKYNAVAKEDDKISCSYERVKKRKRERICMTKRYRYEKGLAAKSDYCSQTLDCESGGITGMSKTLVADRAAAQMKRINQEIIALAKTNPEMHKLLQKSMALQKLYQSKN